MVDPILNSENSEKACRHEYVKMFQRKYKDYGRRLVSTRGYLPTGFSIKDFSFLTAGAFCFCTKCRKRLYPSRGESTRAQNVSLPSQTVDNQVAETTDNIWAEGEIAADASATTSLEIEVEELQIEVAEVTDIVEKDIAVSQEDSIEEEGEE